MSALAPFALAFVAGIISFTSPCCLLMPGCVSYVSGVASDASTSGQGSVAIRSRTMLAAGLFVQGFAITFTVMGAAAWELGGLIVRNRLALGQVAGVFVIVMGLATIGLLQLPFLYRERRFDLSRIRLGPSSALPLGMALAIAWTQCIGPSWRSSPPRRPYMGRGGVRRCCSFTRSVSGPLPPARARRLRPCRRMITGAWIRLFAPLLRVFSRSGWPPI